MRDVYEVIFGRRDVRGEFTPDLIPDKTLARLILAAHHAPSVGLSQPWNFILVRDPELKQLVHAAFCEANTEAQRKFGEQRGQLYSELKLEGILESPLNLCITCDRSRGGSVVLGRTHQPDMDIYSTVCAVQNLWLAARAENIGVGWVSIIEPQRLSEIFQLPDHVVPIAYLCLGYVRYFRGQPELQQRGWTERLPVEDLIYNNRWSEEVPAPLRRALESLGDWAQESAGKDA